MADDINELPVYPEIPTFALINQFDGSERIVTEAMLNSAFPDESERMKILANRSAAWYIIENPYNPNASSILY